MAVPEQSVHLGPGNIHPDIDSPRSRGWKPRPRLVSEASLLDVYTAISSLHPYTVVPVCLCPDLLP